MKITRVSTEITSAPKKHAIRDAIQLLDRDGHCKVRIETDGGIVGQSDIYFGRVASAPAMLAALIDEQLGPEIIGEDSDLIRNIRDKLRKLTDYQGTSGLCTFGIAAIDLALWDLLGKSLGVPVWKLLGAQRAAVPAYAMVGWFELAIPELRGVCETAMRQGFRGVKVKVGGGDLADDVARIKAVREVIGDGVPLMVDANQAFDFSEALRRGRRYEELDCRWFEEPLPAHQTEAHIRLSERLDIPVAAGENRYGQQAFRDLIAGGGIGIVQPDLRRAGGVTDCMEIGLMAAGFGISYASHGGGPHIHVLGALPNAIYVECSLLPADGRVKLVDGCLPLPTEPGLSSWY
jgi:L-alanine-DL-glutamate epimerase-like enolase superfamily enzyme